LLLQQESQFQDVFRDLLSWILESKATLIEQRLLKEGRLLYQFPKQVQSLLAQQVALADA
jgi:hypothetical protein